MSKFASAAEGHRRELLLHCDRRPHVNTRYFETWVGTIQRHRLVKIAIR